MSIGTFPPHPVQPDRNQSCFLWFWFGLLKCCTSLAFTGRIGKFCNSSKTLLFIFGLVPGNINTIYQFFDSLWANLLSCFLLSIARVFLALHPLLCGVQRLEVCVYTYIICRINNVYLVYNSQIHNNNCRLYHLCFLSLWLLFLPCIFCLVTRLIITLVF